MNNTPGKSAMNFQVYFLLGRKKTGRERKGEDRLLGENYAPNLSWSRSIDRKRSAELWAIWRCICQSVHNFPKICTLYLLNAIRHKKDF